MSDESTLGYALLGLLQHEPRSGYDVRKVFLSTPLGHFSDSPGAIYPALRRLERRGWIQVQQTQSGGRRRQTFAPSPSGRAALTGWLSHAPTPDDVARRWDEQMLRLALMSGVVAPAVVRRFLEALEQALGEHLATLDAFMEGPGQTLPPLPQLAFESGLEGFRAQARWVKRARARLATGRYR